MPVWTQIHSHSWDKYLYILEANTFTFLRQYTLINLSQKQTFVWESCWTRRQDRFSESLTSEWPGACMCTLKSIKAVTVRVIVVFLWELNKTKVFCFTAIVQAGAQSMVSDVMSLIPIHDQPGPRQREPPLFCSAIVFSSLSLARSLFSSIPMHFLPSV